MYTLLAISISGISTTVAAMAKAWVTSYGYVGVFILMLMEAASLPVPSEVVLPLAGLLAHNGALSFYLALAAAIIGSMVGSVVDYAIGYYLGKEVVYKHLRLFHIKKRDLDSFDAWFDKNGLAAVFLTRFIPVLRTIINFPAGFAKMDFRKFLAYTLLGTVIWDVVLMAFGFYLLSARRASVALAAVAVFGIALYAVYRFAASRMRKG